MNTSTSQWLCILGSSLLAACSGQPEEKEELDLFSMVDSEASVRCVATNRISSMKVLNDRAIEVKMQGGATYINILPHRCPGLRPNQPFMYETSINRLCDLDLIRVLDTAGFGMRPTGACGLGKFQPLIAGGPAVVGDDED